MADTTGTITLRLEPAVQMVIKVLAKQEGIEESAYILRLVQRHAANSDAMPRADQIRINATERLIDLAIATARDLDADGQFDQHFTLTVIRALAANPAFMADYDLVTRAPSAGGRVSYKASLNMNLGWHIKCAVNAIPLRDDKTNLPRRMQIRNELIKSYTLLKK